MYTFPSSKFEKFWFTDIVPSLAVYDPYRLSTYWYTKKNKKSFSRQNQVYLVSSVSKQVQHYNQVHITLRTYDLSQSATTYRTCDNSNNTSQFRYVLSMTKSSYRKTYIPHTEIKTRTSLQYHYSWNTCKNDLAVPVEPAKTYENPHHKGQN